MGVPYAEVIGDPIAHSRSPEIHKFWLERLGIDGDYRALRVAPAELSAYLAMRRNDPLWRGCNVTMPHKQAIVPLLCEVSPPADSINCVLPKAGRLTGTDTDGNGIREATGHWDMEASGTLCLIGAGGAARAFFAAIDVDCCFDYRLIVRDRAKGARLMAKLGMAEAAFSFEEAEQAIQGCVGVINASPLGMTGFPPMPEPVLASLCGVDPNGYALDMVTSPLDTPFLQRAREAGLSATDGLTMLIGQARAAFALFFGDRPTKACDAELRDALLR